MSSRFLRCDTPLSRCVTIWFALDWFVALFPPIHWGIALPLPNVLGLPVTLAYFLGVSLCICASIAFAYWVDTRRGIA
ncbi:hypothetical protein [Paraburkholderia caffeinilytica]|uniref:hypothetical protein n=1 Tax=Paraburkholderia caffeinilytica TaxID=1761016 RepID=UPI0038BC0900